MKEKNFIETVWAYYAHHQRDLPWRQSEPDGSFSLYKIMVSEVMLQQTQVSRVVAKYQEFLEKFPTADALASAPLAEVLKSWSGLGYNRRARFLHEAAKQLQIIKEPVTVEDLTALPGIGKNTARAILAYSYNQPHSFIETNIRTVYIHHFFADRFDVDDKELEPYITKTLDHENPREWFWALMDYGAYLKANIGNVSRLSKHYTKQSRFEGSRRQLRGQLLRLLADQPSTLKGLTAKVSDERLMSVISELINEGLVSKKHNTFYLG